MEAAGMGRMGEDLPSSALFHTSHNDDHDHENEPCFSPGSPGDTTTPRAQSRQRGRPKQKRRTRRTAIIQGPLVKLWKQTTTSLYPSKFLPKHAMLEDSGSEDEQGNKERSLRRSKQSLSSPIPFPLPKTAPAASKRDTQARSSRSSSWRTRIPKRLKTSTKERFFLSIPSPHKSYENRNNNNNNNMTPNTIDTKDTFGYIMDHEDDYEDEDEHEFCLEEEDSSPHSWQDTPSSSPLLLQYIRRSPRGSNRHHHQHNDSTTEAEQLYFRGMQDALAQERTKVADLISLSTQTILRRNRGGNRLKNTLPLQIIRWHDRLVLGAELRATQDRMRKEIEYLETANTHLKARAVTIQTSQKREWNISSNTMQVYLAQATTCSATNAQDVVALVQERKRTLEALHERLVQEIGMVFLRTVLKTSRRGDDGLTMNALGLELAVKRLSSLPHVTLHVKTFRALCVRERYSILWIYRHLIDDDDDTTRVVPNNKERVFSLSLTYSCTTNTSSAVSQARG
eukprot:scaffold366382_cov53-Attheya_sp.AAC.2